MQLSAAPIQLSAGRHRAGPPRSRGASRRWRRWRHVSITRRMQPDREDRGRFAKGRPSAAASPVAARVRAMQTSRRRSPSSSRSARSDRPSALNAALEAAGVRRTWQVCAVFASESASSPTQPSAGPPKSFALAAETSGGAGRRHDAGQLVPDNHDTAALVEEINLGLPRSVTSFVARQPAPAAPNKVGPSERQRVPKQFHSYLLRAASQAEQLPHDLLFQNHPESPRESPRGAPIDAAVTTAQQAAPSCRRP